MQKPISAGTVISHRYQVQKKIHDNVFNSCYLAEDSENSNRLVMLSLPRIELLILQDFTATFYQVCTKLLAPSFSGSLKVLGSGEHNSQPYAVLQYVTDETLEHVLGRKRVSGAKVDLDMVLDWATPLAVTLDDLHAAGYVHGSLKPSSVYIGSQKILMGDFITECTLQLLGKFKNGITTLNIDEYLAPEYLKSSYTANYDQYLLATMVYEALAGKVPFARSKGGDDYRMQVATHVSPLLTAHRPELKAVSDILAKAMKRKPSDRYKSCRDFVSELQAARAAEPAKPPPQKRVVITTPFSDEPEEEEEIITSIRKNDNRSGSKKGLLWLGVLFLAGGATAFTAVNYPHVLGLGDQQQASDDGEPAIVPVSLASNTKATEPTVVEPVVKRKVDIAPETDIAAATSEVVVESTEVNDVSVEKELQQQSSSNEDGITAQTVEELNRVVSQAIASGQESFTAAKAAEANLIAQNAALEEAVELALLKGQDNYMNEAATVALADLPDTVVEAPAVDVNSQPVDATESGALSEVGDDAAVNDTDSSTVVDPLSEISPVPVDPVVERQSARERLEAIKQQKIAHIKNITDDCTIGSKIHRETAAGNLSYVKNCMSVGVSPNLTQSNGWTLLHIAARQGDLNLCKLLIAKGATVNAKANNGQTALAMAISLRQEQVAAYLRTRGAQ